MGMALYDNRALVNSIVVYTTQVNSTLCSRWLASSEVISQVPFTSEQPKKNKMAFVGILSQIKLLFGPASYSACVVYTNTIIHLSVGESGVYLPPLRRIIVNCRAKQFLNNCLILISWEHCSSSVTPGANYTSNQKNYNFLDCDWFKKLLFFTIYLPSCYGTVCYWTVCYWTVCYRTVQ